ncbi:MAG: hypothetical protein LW701_09600 [Fluviicola sp.]|jgi:hypothetical protein|nr:hypothetical protein [Fluviicola sp.]
MKLSIQIIIMIVGLNAYGQSNELFSKKYEQAIYMVRQKESTPKLLKIKASESFDVRALEQIENVLVEKKGFYNFEVDQTNKIMSIYYLSFIDLEIIESIVEKEGVKFKVISNEIDQKMIEKQ